MLASLHTLSSWDHVGKVSKSLSNGITALVLGILVVGVLLNGGETRLGDLASLLAGAAIRSLAVRVFGRAWSRGVGLMIVIV